MLHHLCCQNKPICNNNKLTTAAILNILVPIRRDGNISHLFISLATQRSMGEVAEPPHYFQQLWWCNHSGRSRGGGGVEGFERTPLRQRTPCIFRNGYILLYWLQNSNPPIIPTPPPPPSHNSGSAPVSVKASDQCLKGRWFESTPRQPSLTVHMPAHTLRIISRYNLMGGGGGGCITI